MATFTKFDNWHKALAEGVHKLHQDVLKIMLTNTPPSTSWSVMANVTGEVANGNGYTTGGATCSFISSTQTNGVYTLVVADPPSWTATGGSMGPFRYAILYNSSTAGKDLIAFTDYGSSTTLADTETFTVDLNQATGVYTLS